MALPFSENIKLINAVTTTVADPVTTNGTNTLDVSHRQLRSIQFTASAISAGNGVFKVYVSNDNGANWIQYNRLTDNLTNTNAQNDTRVASVTLSTNSSKIYFFPIGDYFQLIGVSCVVTTDGTYTATLQVAG